MQSLDLEPQDSEFGEGIEGPGPDDSQMHEFVELQKRVMKLQFLASLSNAAEEIEEEELGNIGGQVVREYRIDKDSRSEWEDRAKRAMDLARQKKESKSTPWPDASNVKYPLLTTAALQFAARAYPAIVDGPRIVKCAVMGADPDGAKASAADRVSQHMSFQLGYEVPDWECDIDTLLHQIPIVGCAFKKVYADPSKPAGFCSDMISAFDLVVNQKAKSLETVPRITHVFPLYPHEVTERQRTGVFLEVDLKHTSDTGDDEDAPLMFLEQHRYLDLDDDDVMEPWIVTVHEASQKVVKIRAAFDPAEIEFDRAKPRITRIKRKDYFVKVPFIPDPEGGFYDVGFGHLLEPISDVIDTTINQMMDAGTLQNGGGGFIGGGVDLGKGKSTISLRPGEYKTIRTAGPDLRQSIYNMEHPGPSKVLFDLLSLMIDAGKDIAAIQDILVGDTPRVQTATTTMAAIEQGLKVFTAIYKRIFRALKAEFRMIFDINKTTLRMPKYLALLDQPVSPNDYQGEFDVMPVSDPNAITDMQRMSRAQLVMEEAKNGNPTINLHEATKRMMEAARIERVEELMVPPPEGPSPQEQLVEDGLKVDIDLKLAQIDKTRAETDKVAAEAALAHAQAMLPPGVPVPIATPQFMPPEMGGEMPPPQEMPMMQGDPGLPPEMAGAPPDMGMPPPMQDMPPEMMGAPMGEIPPEVMDQIAAEQMAMSPDGMPQELPPA